ncbi:MAG: hypothetical protein ACREBI_02475 [Nitrosotalea sp.]
MARRKKKDDDWVDAAIAVGIGALALYFLKKLSEGAQPETQQTCPYCGTVAGKWARACSNCRNTLPL